MGECFQNVLVITVQDEVVEGGIVPFDGFEMIQIALDCSPLHIRTGPLLRAR
jgi:hypothetical protein